MTVGEEKWSEVIKWNSFRRITGGKQLVWAADSIAANIAEGYGRFSYKDSNRFYFISRGSILETKS